MAKLLTCIDYLAQAYNDRGPVPLSSDLSVHNNENLIQPVNSLEELNALEETLKNDATMRNHIDGMCFICGNSGKSNGTDCCYKLIDYFVTRHFLLRCSWTGNARALNPKQSTNSKVPLKFYKGFRKLFLKLVMLADKDFTEMDCESFFKRVMKNSKQRLEAKINASKHKNRPTKLKYNFMLPVKRL